MTEQIKQCRVCGDPIDTHRLPLQDCIKKVFELPVEWPANYQAYLVLCLQHNYLDSYGQAGPGVMSIKFNHKEEKLLTATPVDDIARVLLTEVVLPKPIGIPLGADISEYEGKLEIPGEKYSLLEEEGKEQEEDLD
jgi:hypothetical protein